MLPSLSDRGCPASVRRPRRAAHRGNGHPSRLPRPPREHRVSPGHKAWMPRSCRWMCMVAASTSYEARAGSS